MNSGFDPGPSNHDTEIVKMQHRRHRKQVIESDPEEEDEVPLEPAAKFSRPLTYSMDTDISTLEAPTFTTLNHGPSEIMTMLRWDHPVHLIGKKVVNPILHVCEKCQLPILSYGRLSPCKHVLCHDCAQALWKTGGQCGRCSGKVSNVEQAGLGKIHMCMHGGSGSRYGLDGCRKTYLSERDLQAHIQFRHSGKSKQSQQQQQQPPVPSAEAIAAATAALVAENHMSRSNKVSRMQYLDSRNQLPNFSQPPPQVMTRSTNLITVPIQDNAGGSSSGGGSGSSASDHYWNSKSVQPNMHQPPPNYYRNPPPVSATNNAAASNSHQQHQSHHYSQVHSSSYNDHQWNSNSRTGANANNSGYHSRR